MLRYGMMCCIIVSDLHFKTYAPAVGLVDDMAQTPAMSRFVSINSSCIEECQVPFFISQNE